MVLTDAAGYKSVNYAQLTPVLIEALKELATRNAALEAQAAVAGQRATQSEATTAGLTTAVQRLEQRLRALEATGTQARGGH